MKLYLLFALMDTLILLAYPILFIVSKTTKIAKKISDNPPKLKFIEEATCPNSMISWLLFWAADAAPACSR